MTIAMNRLYRTALAAALTLTTASLRAADETVCESPEASEPLSSRTIRLKEAVVTGRRLADIGVTKMNLDSVALRQNVTNSLGDLLSQSTPVFIKSYGRGTMATASFRGTAPSNTQVTWNGMKINSPMLGMVDFSLIPSYFIDEASLYHGAGSVGVSGGGLGGAITLGTKPLGESGAGVHFIQGISSFDTYDEFLRFTYGTRKFESSTRVCYVTSDNDFKYRNYDKYEQIDGQWVYPMERNKNCSYRDFHLLQEFYYQPDERNRFGLAAWVTDSRRGIPMLTVDYKQEGQARSTQDETTLRAVASWDRRGDGLKMGAKAGYIYSYILYRYDGNPDPDSGELQQMIHSHSRINTGYGQFYAEYYPTPKWALTANASVNVHSVSSLDDPDLGGAQPEDTIRLGYDKVRAEVSLLATVKYRPHPRLGLGIDLRGESYGRNLTPLIPAGFVDYTLWPRFGVVLKASVARNYRYPSLNDLYFKPGGNDSLKTEKGYTYEGGMEFRVKEGVFDFGGEVTVYNSHIRDWIVWLPTFKGFWTPLNVKKVHSYGVELRGDLSVKLGRLWALNLNAFWAKTRSINWGDPKEWYDQSIGKQLVYVPEYSSGVTGRLSWRGYELTYRYNYYSERYTTSSNEKGSSLYLLNSYYMNDLGLGKTFRLSVGELSVKLWVYNLFDEEYVSVLSRPMPGRNFGLFIGITPRWDKKRR